jgi:phage N-6-adenine-methyltransferase
MTADTLFGDPEPDRIRRAGIGSHHSHASITDEWLTPSGLIDRLTWNNRRGLFDLDPCAPLARPWPTARRHFTAVDNGLRRQWDGSVWLNPPYSAASAWVARLAEHGLGTALVFARTETQWWHDSVWPCATGILFLRGRLTFCYPDGREGRYNAGGPSALIAYGGTELDRLYQVKDLGKLVRL